MFVAMREPAYPLEDIRRLSDTQGPSTQKIYNPHQSVTVYGVTIDLHAVSEGQLLKSRLISFYPRSGKVSDTGDAWKFPQISLPVKYHGQLKKTYIDTAHDVLLLGPEQYAKLHPSPRSEQFVNQARQNSVIIASISREPGTLPHYEFQTSYDSKTVPKEILLEAKTYEDGEITWVQPFTKQAKALSQSDLRACIDREREVKQAMKGLDGELFSRLYPQIDPRIEESSSQNKPNALTFLHKDVPIEVTQRYAGFSGQVTDLEKYFASNPSFAGRELGALERNAIRGIAKAKEVNDVAALNTAEGNLFALSRLSYHGTQGIGSPLEFNDWTHDNVGQALQQLVEERDNHRDDLVRGEKSALDNWT